MASEHQNIDQFPVESMPSIFCEATQSVSAAVGAPISMVAGVALAAAALACQGRYRIRTPVGNVSPTSLYVVNVSKSGERKTPVEKRFFQGIRDIEGIQERSFSERQKVFQIGEDIWSAEAKALKRKLGSATKQGEDLEAIKLRLRAHHENRPQRPLDSTVFYSDVTPQALFARLSRGGASAMLQTSEGSIVLSRLQTSALASFNVLWDGEEIKAERQDGKNFRTGGARLSMSIMAQVGVIRKFLRKGEGGARDVGFLARCLVSAPSSSQGYRDFYNLSDCELQSLNAFNEAAAAVFNVGRSGQTPTTEACETLELSSDAADEWRSFYSWVERRLRPHGDFADISDFSSKILENACRIAAVFHVVSGRSGAVIEAATLRSALSVCEWYLWEFKRLFGNRSELSEDFEDSLVLRRLLIERYCDRDGRVGVDLVSLRNSCLGYIGSQSRVDAAIMRIRDPRFFYLREIGRRRVAFFDRQRLLEF